MSERRGMKRGMSEKGGEIMKWLALLRARLHMTRKEEAIQNIH
jgi:hypothetical protein